LVEPEQEIHRHGSMGSSLLPLLCVPPGNRLESLKGDRAGSFSIRVNDQYRVTFRFKGEDAYDVRCEDYH
jgi:proteic killer suppression protein